jgi:iron complex outermembrane receptor protein
MQQSFSVNKVYNFKRWSRKSYAIFNSLKIQIRIASLVVSLLITMSIPKGFTQTISTRTLPDECHLDTVDIIGELTPTTASGLVRAIDIIQTVDLQPSCVKSLQNALNALPQIDIRQRASNDIQTDLSIRGSGFDQVQVLLNGFDISDPQTGHHSFNLPVSYNQIAGIEVVSGSASRVLGPNAFAGSINLITPKPTHEFIDLSLNLGDFGLTQLTASFSHLAKKTAHFWSADYGSSRSYQPNTDFRRLGVFYYGERKYTKTEINWQSGISDKSFGAQSFYTPKYPIQFEQLRNAFAAFSIMTKGRISTINQFHYKANADRFELFREGQVEIPNWYANHNYHLSQIAQFTSKVWLNSRFGKSSFALNFRSENILSNVLGLTQSDTIHGIIDAKAFYYKSDSRFYSTFSFDQKMTWNRLKVGAGLMIYLIPQTTLEFGIYPGFDIKYSLSNKVDLYAGFNTGMRLPTFTDLYYSGPSNVGNIYLKAENLNSFELGISTNGRLFQGQFSTFYNVSNNTIDWVRLSDTVKWQPINLTKVISTGIDFSMVIFTNRTKFNVLKGFNVLELSWSFLNKSSSSAMFQSHYSMDYLKNKLVLHANYQIVKQLTIDLRLRFHQRMGQYLNYDVVSGKEYAIEYQPFVIVDARLNYSISGWRLYVDLSNVFNISYFDYGNVEQAGRWFSIGIAKKLELK